MLATCLVLMLEEDSQDVQILKAMGCIEEVKGHVDGRGQDEEDLFTLLVNSVCLIQFQCLYQDDDNNNNNNKLKTLLYKCITHF